MEWNERDGLRWLEADLGGARTAFTTRLGGVSEPPFDRLNLGLLTEDDPRSVHENRRRLCAALGFAPDRVAHARQVHGAALARAGDGAGRPFFTSGTDREPGSPGDLPEADGQIVAEAGTAALVFVADCLPVALYGPGGVAMVHCGWRGLAAGILAGGAAAVGATAAAIGPGIGPCCFEVGTEVAARFAGLGGDVVVSPGAERSGFAPAVATRPHVDLPAVARRLLADAGVGQVQSADLCTACDPELFFSHRRDAGRSGRQAGLAWLEPAARPAGANAPNGEGAQWPG